MTLRLPTYHFLVVSFILISISASAQTIFQVSNLEADNERWVQIKEIPKEKFQKGYIGYRFYAPASEESNLFELYGETKKGELIRIKSWENKCIFYPEKSDRTAIYTENGITVHSELSYKSTSVNCIFKFKGTTLDFYSLDVNDANGDLVFIGDSLLLQGDVAGAITAYNKIFHPANYMNMTGKGVEILEVAYPLALEASEKGNYEDAANLMGKAFEFPGIWMLDGDAFVNAGDLDKYEKELWKYERGIRELIEMYTVDYGFFLYKAQKFPESITLNRYISNMLPNCASPCLYWADALYDTGKTEQAKQPYRLYLQRMQMQDRIEEAPERATKRAN